MIIFYILSALTVLLFGFLYAFLKLIKLRQKYIIGLEKFIDESKKFDAIVLDLCPVVVDGRNVKAVIVQFRDEENQKTIIHRYTFSHKKDYKRGDKVVLYYNDEKDTACIYSDNPFSKKSLLSIIFAFICFAMACIDALSMIIYIIYIIFSKQYMP